MREKIFLLAIVLFLATVSNANSQSNPRPSSASSTAGAKAIWAGIVVSDCDASAKWYEDKLHFALTRKMDLPEHHLKIRFLDLNGFTVELVESKDAVSFQSVQRHMPELKDRDKLLGFVKLGFLVSNVDALAAELRNSGVELRMGPTDDRPFGTRFFLVEDNDGNLLQFFQALK